MGGKNVKNTIVERLMQLVAPHPCSGCGKIGSLLCLHCKYDIVSEPFLGCILCARPELNGVCKTHESAFQKAYVVGLRDGVLRLLIDGLKFHYMKEAAKSAAELLDEHLPILPMDTVIVPVPTLTAHIRQRGFDQVDLIARHLGYLRGLDVKPLLSRAGNATQHHLKRRERLVEAKSAFELSPVSSGSDSSIKLLIDDIITTGSTVSEAAKLLAQDGSTVIVGALAYQPLD
jgi:ComF family protein